MSSLAIDQLEQPLQSEFAVYTIVILLCTQWKIFFNWFHTMQVEPIK